VNYAVLIVPLAGNIKVPFCFGIGNVFAYMKIKSTSKLFIEAVDFLTLKPISFHHPNKNIKL